MTYVNVCYIPFLCYYITTLFLSTYNLLFLNILNNHFSFTLMSCTSLIVTNEGKNSWNCLLMSDLFHMQLSLYEFFVWKAVHKDHHALETRGSAESHQILEDEREALVSVDDVV